MSHTEYTPEIQSLAHAMDGMSHQERCAALYELQESFTHYTAKRELEARIKELNHVLGSVRKNFDCTTCWNNIFKIEDRLRVQLVKAQKEQEKKGA